MSEFDHSSEVYRYCHHSGCQSKLSSLEQQTTPETQGDLSKMIEIEAEGEMAILKNVSWRLPIVVGRQLMRQTVNRMVRQLTTFATEVTRVALEVGTQGILGGQAVVEGVEGVWEDLTTNVNVSADTVLLERATTDGAENGR